jgi:hypothetical protein
MDMVYMFEFFAVEGAGARLLLNTTKYRVKTGPLADAYGKATIRNVAFHDRKASICVIKDQVGHILREVAADV